MNTAPDSMPSLAGRKPTQTFASNSVAVPKLLIIEKKAEIEAILKGPFLIDAVPAPNASADKLREATYDLVIWDAENSHAKRAMGLEFLDRLSREAPDTQIMVISHDEGDPLLGRFKGSRYHYVRRPIDRDKFCALVNMVLEKRPVSQSVLSYPEVRVPIEFEGMIGISLPMFEVFQRVVEASSADIPVLVSGETGTGKELVAAAIHNKSKRKDKPYVPVNTGAIAPELIASELFGHEKGAYTGALDTRRGFFEQANGGTIFLDEISTMDEKAQIGLLRVLETKTFRRVRGEKDIHVDVRVIAATNQDLQEAIRQKRFREDLYYRLDVFRIHLPALRDRPGGVTFLTNHFIIIFNALYHKNLSTVSPETYRCLRRYSWPGNVRELKNVIQRAVLMAQREELTLDLIPARIREAAEVNTETATPAFPIRPGMTLDTVEKEYIAMTLAATRGNKKEAALQLGISRRALYNKLKRHGLIQFLAVCSLLP